MMTSHYGPTPEALSRAEETSRLLDGLRRDRSEAQREREWLEDCWGRAAERLDEAALRALVERAGVAAWFWRLGGLTSAVMRWAVLEQMDRESSSAPSGRRRRPR